MLKSARLKLALSYLSIIMVMSLSFSFVLFRISGRELNHSLRLPPPNIQINLRQVEFEQFRQERLEEGSSRLRTSLIAFNIIALGLGAVISYYLALRTLLPIETAMEAQNRFTADASHELRTPLTAIQTEIEVALRNPKLTGAQAKALLASNLEEVEKLKSLSNRLLRLAQQDSQSLSIETVNINKVVTEAIRVVRPLAEAKNLTIVTKIKNQKLKLDSHAMTEVLVILLNNAVNYTGPAKKITISSAVNKDTFELTIKDQGYGISQADIKHIFERFYRVERSRNKNTNNGFGLGLSIADQIIKQHGGVITVISSVGKGSEFTINLPLQAVLEPTPSKSSAS